MPYKLKYVFNNIRFSLFVSQASTAVSYLNRIHSLKKRGPVPCSMYLEQLLRHSGMYKDRPLTLSMQKNKLLDLHIRKVREKLSALSL